MKRKLKKNEITQVSRFNPSIESGLSIAELKFRRENGEINKTEADNERTYLQIIIGNVFTFFNMLMVSLAAILVIFVGPETILNLFFLFLMFVNTIIGTVQECKSKKAIKKLKLISASKIEAIRDGKSEEIFINEIVLDDIIKLKGGDQIPADCIIKTDGILEVNESLLTGESRAVKKTNGDYILAGSFVISGSCKAQVDKIGNDTYLHSIESKARNFKKPKSKLMISINKIIKILASVAVPLAIIVFINEILSGGVENYKNALFYACLTIPYMIPAGMMLLSSISMATGVINLGKKKVLAQDLYSVEALSRVDTLCLDKTGTLTDGTMTVEKTTIMGQGDIEGIISSYLSAFETANQTSNALIKKYGKEQVYKIKNKVEFSSARKYSAVEFENGDIYILGAPEYLTDDEEILEKAKEYSKVGNRVVLMEKLVFGKIVNGELEKKRSKHFAMFIIRDNVRPEVPETMKWFRENGVDIKVISGDNAGTVSYIAKKSGIKNWDKVVDMSILTEKDNLELLVMNNSVFARVTPEQKAEIVDILKKNKRIVAMSGDGVNDIISLKKADCSIALANGAPATKNISNLVLLDSNFNNMKEAVFEGRRVVNNIQRSSTLFVMKDFLWMFITIWPILIGAPHVIEGTVVGIVNTFITGIGSFCLALEPDRSKIEGNFLKNIIGKSIVSGFFMFLPVVLAYIYSFAVCGFDINIVSEYIKTNMYPLISICITVCGFVILFKLCRPFTKFRAYLCIGLLLLVVLLLLLIPDLFLRKGTDFIKELMAIYGTNIMAILKALWNSLFSFTIYKTLTTSQWIIIGGFCVLSMSLYSITDWLVSKFLNITMFNPKRFEETDDD